MFGNFFNKIYYGTARKKDLTKEDVYNKSKLNLFFEVLSVRFWKLIQLNLLYSVFFVPLIIIFSLLQRQVSIDLSYIFIIMYSIIAGPATAGFMYVLRKYSIDEHAWVWSDFKKAALRDLKPSIVIMLTNIIVFIIFNVNLKFYANMGSDSILYMVLFFIVLALLIVFIMMNIYIFPLLVTYKLSIKDIYKDAFIFTVVQLPYTFLIALLCTAIIYFSFIIPLTIILLFVFTLSLVGLIINSFANYVFDKYMNNQNSKQQEVDKDK